MGHYRRVFRGPIIIVSHWPIPSNIHDRNWRHVESPQLDPFAGFRLDCRSLCANRLARNPTAGAVSARAPIASCPDSPGRASPPCTDFWHGLPLAAHHQAPSSEYRWYSWPSNVQYWPKTECSQGMIKRSLGLYPIASPKVSKASLYALASMARITGGSLA